MSLLLLFNQAVPWLNQAAGTATRNGTADHTIPFGFTSAAGSRLLFVVFGAVTHTEASGTWTEPLEPVSSGELSVFTKISTGDSSITLNHNGSNFPVHWCVFEAPAGASYTAGAGDTASTETFAALTGLPGTAQVVIAARGRTATSASETGASTAWDPPWVEAADLYTGYSPTDGGHLTVAYQTGVTATSVTPSATTTYSGSWSTPDREKVVFAIALAGGTTHNASVTLAATGSLTGTATRDTSTTATLAATGTLTGTVTRATDTTATLAATGTLTAAGERTQTTTATLAATGTLTASGARSQATTVTLAASGALTATGTTGADQSATLAATGTLTATGDRTAVATAVLAATGTLTGTAAATRVAAVTLAATGTLTAVGDATTPGIQTATLSGTGALSATAVRTAVDIGLLAGVGALTGTVARATSAMATLAGIGSLTATAIVVPPGDATSAPTSALRTSSRPTVLSTVSRPLVLRTGRPPT